MNAPAPDQGKKLPPSRPPQPPKGKLLASRREAAQALGISERTIDYMIADGVIEIVLIGRRPMIPWTEVERIAGSRKRKVRTGNPGPKPRPGSPNGDGNHHHAA